MSSKDPVIEEMDFVYRDGKQYPYNNTKLAKYPYDVVKKVFEIITESKEAEEAYFSAILLKKTAFKQRLNLDEIRRTVRLTKEELTEVIDELLEEEL